MSSTDSCVQAVKSLALPEQILWERQQQGHPSTAGHWGRNKDPQEHKILTAACLYSEFAYREMNRGPLQRDSGLSAVKGIAVRGSAPFPPPGRFPALQARSYPGEAELGPGVQHQREGESSAWTQPQKPPGVGRAETWSWSSGGQMGQGETQAAESSLLLMEVNIS